MNEQPDEQAINDADAGAGTHVDVDTFVEAEADADVESVNVDLSDAHDFDGERIPSQGALPLDVQTGDPRVDAAVSSLRDLDRLPVSEHAEVFTQVHRDLQDALLTLDQG